MNKLLALVLVSLALSGCGHRVGADYLTQSERTLMHTMNVLEVVVVAEEQYINSKTPVNILPPSDRDPNRFLRKNLSQKQTCVGSMTPTKQF